MSLVHGWKTKKICELCHLGRGRVINAQEIDEHPGIYPVYSSQSKDSGKMGSIETYDFEGEYVTWTTDGAYAGTVFYRNGRFNCTNVCGTLEAKNQNELNINFLAYKLSTVAKDHVSYVGNPKLMNGIMAGIEICLPINKPEQAKIAEVLSKVDLAIEQTETLIAKQQRIKTGLMQDLLTRGIDEHGNLRSEETHEFKDSPLGRIPVEWRIFTVDLLGEVVTGSTPSTAVESYYNGDIMFVTPKDINNTSELITQTEKTLSSSGLSVCRAIPENSICTVCIGSTIGKIGLTKSQCATNQQVNTLIPHIPEDAEMLLFAMKLFLRPQLRREAGLQAIPIVNKALFSKMILPFPDDPDEKRRARNVLNAVSIQIDAQIAYSDKLRSLKTALMQDLLTGKVRVTPLMETTEGCQ